MAAVASSKSKRGLFFLLAVLCLVGLASSCKDLDNFKAELEKLEEKINQLKAQKDFLSTLMSETKSFTEPMMANIEKLLSEGSADNDLPLKNLFQTFSYLSDIAKAYLAAEEEVHDAEIANIKPELEKNKQLVHEEHHSELYDFIGHQETFQEDGEQLLKMLSLENHIRLPPAYENMTFLNSVSDLFGTVPLEDRRKLYKLYEEDFRLFGYRKPVELLDG